MKTTLQCCALLNFEQFIQFFKPVYEMVRLLAVEAGTDDSYLDRIGSRWGVSSTLQGHMKMHNG